jgi:hypothetical protein
MSVGTETPRKNGRLAGCGMLFEKWMSVSNKKSLRMEKPFTVVFDFPLEHSQQSLKLCATVQLHHSSPYYVVDRFRLKDQVHDGKAVSLLPRVEIERIVQDGKQVWVDKDSKRSSLLSIAIGKAIEESGHFE